jgi:hypothetical protein
MNIKIGTYNLAGDDWNQKVSGLDINWTRDVVIQKHFRAKYPKIRNGDNQVAVITFQVARLHDDYGKALKFMLDHGENLPTSGTVTIEEDTDSGRVRRFFEMAGCQSFNAKRIGVTTLHNYQIVGTRIYASAAQSLALSRQSLRAGSESTTGATGAGTGSTSSSSSTLVTAIEPIENRAELKALVSSAFRNFVILKNPEPRVPRFFQYVHGDTRTPDDYSIIRPTDNAGNYIQVNL